MENTVEQSRTMDELLQKMNESLKGRLESEIPLGDPFWQHRQVYQTAFHAAGQIHVPETAQVELDRKKEEDKIIKEHKDKMDAEVAEKIAAKRAEFAKEAEEAEKAKGEEVRNVEAAKGEEVKKVEEVRKAEEVEKEKLRLAQQKSIPIQSNVEVRPNEPPTSGDEQLRALGL